MKFSVLQENLAPALAVVARAIDTRPTLPVLANVLIVARGDQVKLYATNYEIAITAYVGAQIDEEGAVTIPAKELTGLVSSFAPGRLTLELDRDNQRTRIKAGKSSYTISGIDASEFPQAPEHEASSVFTLPASALGQMIDEVLYATGTNASHPIMASVSARVQDGGIGLGAVDGFRAALSHTEALDSADAVELIIPSASLREVRNIFRDGDVQIGVVRKGKTLRGVRFDCEGVSIFSGLTEGKFPDINRYLPTEDEFSVQADVETQELRMLLKRARIFGKDVGFQCVLQFVPDDGVVMVFVDGNERGDGEDVIPAEMVGSALRIAVNLSWLLEAVEAAGGDTITLAGTTPDRHLIVLGSGTGMVASLKIKESVVEPV